MFNLKLLFIFLFCLLSSGIFSQEKGLESENRLFHIERSKNRNLVCYDVNIEGGKLAGKHPIEVYWINRENRPGEVTGLSGMEKRLAYGYKVISQEEDSCTIVLTAYSERELTICKEDGNYVCKTIIDEQPAILKKLYVKAKPNNSLSVEYIQLTGVSLSTGEEVSEKVMK